jgi:hypothetical protein
LKYYANWLVNPKIALVIRLGFKLTCIAEADIIEGPAGIPPLWSPRPLYQNCR